MPLPRLSARPPIAGQYTAPGSFNRWVTLYNPPNPTAGVQASAFRDTWAAMRALGGDELDKAQQIAQRVSHLVTIRYQPGVLESMQVGMYEGAVLRMFQIAAIEDPDERHVELRMMCFEINQNAGSAS